LDLDAHAASPVGRGSGDHDAAVARSEIVNDVSLTNFRQLEHRRDNGLRGLQKRDIRPARVHGDDQKSGHEKKSWMSVHLPPQRVWVAR
jgi:hypothetical protein